MKASENTPTSTITNKFFVKIAAKTVGIEASKLFQLTDGKWPKCWIKRFEIHKADIITTGTKLKYSTTIWGKLIFFNKIKGRTLEIQVTIAHPIIVNDMNSKEDTFYPHT